MSQSRLKRPAAGHNGSAPVGPQAAGWRRNPLVREIAIFANSPGTWSETPPDYDHECGPSDCSARVGPLLRRVVLTGFFCIAVRFDRHFRVFRTDTRRPQGSRPSILLSAKCQLAQSVHTGLAPSGQEMCLEPPRGPCSQSPLFTVKGTSTCASISSARFQSCAASCRTRQPFPNVSLTFSRSNTECRTSR